MRNEVSLSGTLISTPLVELTQNGGKKITFTLITQGMYNPVPVTVQVFAMTAFILEGRVEQWKRGDHLSVEGSLDYSQGELVVVAHYVGNISRLLERKLQEQGLDQSLEEVD